MPSSPWSGDLTLGNILDAAGVLSSDVLAARHTYKPDGITGPQDASPERVLAYTRSQELRNKIGSTPPELWLAFIADGQRRSRFFGAYENHGEIAAERTTDRRFFDLRPSSLMTSLHSRLVVQWSADTINWAKRGQAVGAFPIIEIADPAAVQFPGFDRVIISFAELQEIVESSRYRAWQNALSEVQGVYLITDEATGQQYVGKADGSERLLGRWRRYAQTGHGDNVGLRGLLEGDIARASSFRFSILRVFGPDTPKADVDAAEVHYKQALMSRTFGLNGN